jgi:hypothetical protein
MIKKKTNYYINGKKEYYYSSLLAFYIIAPVLFDFCDKYGFRSISPGGALSIDSSTGVENAAFFLNGVSNVFICVVPWRVRFCSVQYETGISE